MEDKETLENILLKYMTPNHSIVNNPNYLNKENILKALQEAYNLGSKNLADKAREKIDAQIKEEGESEHPQHEIVFGMSMSKNFINQSLTELKK